MVDSLKRVFVDKRVLVTGHTGFVGIWLSKYLITVGSDVCGYSLSPHTHPNKFDALDLSRELKDVRGDILNKDYLKKVIEEFKPEIVFHLAVQLIVLEAYDKPIETFQTNVIGTVNLLDVLRKIESVKTIIVMTSDKSYRNNEWVYPHRETDPLGGKHPYSASKSWQDIVVNSFKESFFTKSDVAISSIRAGNIIGGGDWSRYRIVPDIVGSLMTNNDENIRNPDSTIPWQHVLDPILGMLKLVQNIFTDNIFSSDWNFGPNYPRQDSVRELTEKFIEFWEKGTYHSKKEADTIESSKLQLDVSKARSLLGWSSRYNFEETLKMTVDWYKAYYLKPEEIDQVPEDQIRSHFLGE